MKTFQHRFIEFIPKILENGIVYPTVEYKSAAHKCPCGSAEKVITLLLPKFWKLTFDGISISLHPSIENWSFTCRSHYWIEQNSIVWAEDWNRKKVEKTEKRTEKSFFSKFKKQKQSMGARIIQLIFLMSNPTANKDRFLLKRKGSSKSLLSYRQSIYCSANSRTGAI